MQFEFWRFASGRGIGIRRLVLELIEFIGKLVKLDVGVVVFDVGVFQVAAESLEIILEQLQLRIELRKMLIDDLGVFFDLEAF